MNASPDLGEQIRKTPALWPVSGLRHSPLSAVILTSAEIDHCAGLLALRERQVFRLYATAAVHAELDANPMFKALDRSLVERVILRPGIPFEVAGLQCELVTVPGKAPLYSEGAAPVIGAETAGTAGLAVAAAAAHLLYVPGCAALSETLLGRLHRSDLVLFDGTLFTDEEMIEAGLGVKSGRRMGHLPISGPGGTLDVLARLPGRKLYVHINNTNPILIEGSNERALVEAAGVEVAFDGLEISL